jgi:excisionase family DNA binding protein
MKTISPIQTPYLTLSEAAQFLRISKRTMLRYLAEGKIPFVRFGKKYLFKSDELGGMKSTRISTVEEILA